MYEAAAYSANLFKVMIDPATWIIAAIAAFAFGHRPLWQRIVLALGANGVLIWFLLVRIAGEGGKFYAWQAFAYELAATGVWLAILVGIRAWVRSRK